MRYKTSRMTDDISEDNLLRDVAFNRHSMNDGHHVSPYDNGEIQIGADGIVVKLTQRINEEAFKRTVSAAQRATIGIDLELPQGDVGDWEEMLQGGLQTALESQVIVFQVQGVSRTCTHQLVRTRNAAFHQQSQRASYYGDQTSARMPLSVWLNVRAREAWLVAKDASDYAYRIACQEDISYQDARYVLLEGTNNYIMCEYSLREFINVFAYRGCSMFSWEIVYVMREMRRLLLEAHPWLEPYVKISCEKTSPDPALRKCTFQGWEEVEGQCDFPWAKEANRTFVSTAHGIKKRPGMGPSAKGLEPYPCSKSGMAHRHSRHTWTDSEYGTHWCPGFPAEYFSDADNEEN